MAKSIGLLSLILVIGLLVSGSNALHLPSSTSTGNKVDEGDPNQEDEIGEAGGNSLESTKSAFGAVHVRSIPPPILAQSANELRNSQRIPFMSHLSALKNLINSSSTDLGIGEDVRNRILKYYFVNDLENGRQQQMPQMGTLVHSLQPGGDARSNMFPLRESDIRRLITRFTGHPIEILLRRALRASRNDLARGRRYKAVPDTSFIRFGRSHPMDLMESERIGSGGIDLPIPQEDPADYLMYSNSIDNNNIPYQGDSYPPLVESIMNHDESSSSSSSGGRMIKKGKPATYYLRFG